MKLLESSRNRTRPKRLGLPKCTTLSVQKNTKYTYNIINKGYYPPKNILRYTSNHNTSSGKTQYKILDRYLVETSWGRKSQHTIECEIEYDSEEPVFIIRFNENSQQHVIQSKESSSNVATEYLRRKGSNSHARISAIHVFGLNAIDIEQERERKRKKNRAYSFKPFSVLCEFMKTKCSRSFSLHISKAFEKESLKFYNPNDQPVLKKIQFNIQGKNYLVDYCKEKEDQNINAFVYIIDQNLISRDAYYLKNISIITTNEISHIDDDEVEKEMLKYIGKAGYRKITDILLFVILGLVDRNILNINNQLFTFVSQMMAEFHYMIILYPRNENYEILQKVMEPMINELHSLVNNGLDSTNTNYFCSWYLCSKKKIGIKSKIYMIEKTMEQLQTTKPPPGYSKAPLLYIIPLEHYVLDLLHVMLRIWNRIWSLVIQELKSENRYNDNIRTIISSEMQKISIKFHF
ncbi:6104_t:CDS:2 [Gigaspora margarita]|uniref:6104_t:CDS:1 n=1 Tax=Gigaspora margarita TaxID=4874 RepID=A0ABN7VA90_GIGMA|nr:6104_t:CDS:2 [Gigaspora margarita]